MQSVPVASVVEDTEIFQDDIPYAEGVENRDEPRSVHSACSVHSAPLSQKTIRAWPIVAWFCILSCGGLFCVLMLTFLPLIIHEMRPIANRNGT